MTVKDCVKTMLSKRGWSQRKLAEELGYSGQGSIGKTLLRNDGMGMTVETLIKWADAMEFQIIITVMAVLQHPIRGLPSSCVMVGLLPKPEQKTVS